MSNILEIRGLTKSFGEKKVLSGLDLTVPEHSVFGFVGRNGAGKTTTMKAVLGLLRPEKGEIYVAGERVSYGATPTNRLIGYLPDVPEFYGFMTAREYLSLCGESLGMDKTRIKTRSDELLELVGLKDEKHRVKGYSRGMKQRLGIAQALIGDPKLLICDEPTSALDPIGRRDILDILVSVKEQTTVLFSTHILSDVERICTDVAILEAGSIALNGRIDDVKELDLSREFIVETATAEPRELLLERFENSRMEDDGSIIIPGGDREINELLRFIVDNDIAVRRVEKTEPSLEAMFMEVARK